MKVYLAKAELHGPLFFSSETKHALTTSSHLLVAPKAIISPVPLTYSLNGFPAERYAWRAKEGPRYELFRVLPRKLSYGAVPIRVRYKRFFFAMKGMSWGEYRGKSKMNLPRMATLVALIPPSEFRFSLISDTHMSSPIYMRIGGKRSGILKVNLEEAKIRRETNEGLLTLPTTRGILKKMGCKIRSFTILLSEFVEDPDFGEVGLAEVEGCKVVEACTSSRRCERLALP